MTLSFFAGAAWKQRGLQLQDPIETLENMWWRVICTQVPNINHNRVEATLQSWNSASWIKFILNKSSTLLCSHSELDAAFLPQSWHHSQSPSTSVHMRVYTCALEPYPCHDHDLPSLAALISQRHPSINLALPTRQITTFLILPPTQCFSRHLPLWPPASSWHPGRLAIFPTARKSLFTLVHVSCGFQHPDSSLFLYLLSRPLYTFAAHGYTLVIPHLLFRCNVMLCH